MIDEKKSIIYNKALALILEDNTQYAFDALLIEYKCNPGDLPLFHLLISTHIILQKNNELIELLRYEEGVSLFSAKLGFIRNLLTKNKNASLFDIASALHKRGWSEDGNIYFRLNSILNPDNDKSLIPLGEEAIKSGNFQKGVALFSQAAKNYFKNRVKGMCL